MASDGRGGGWVVAQFALILLVVAATVVPPEWPGRARGALLVAGAVLALGGAGIAVWAARSLGPSLTPFPRPASSGSLVESGPYCLVRHPIYTGGILCFLGWSLYAGPGALALTVCLSVLWALKAGVEERHLVELHPGYAAYVRRVPARLVPGVY
jgi:protein-S-isoprenylcysteine O-methyltransferase Ste14